MKKILFIFFLVYYSVVLLPTEIGVNFRQELRYRVEQNLNQHPPLYFWSWSRRDADCSGQMYSIYGRAGITPSYELERRIKELEDLIKELEKRIKEKEVI